VSDKPTKEISAYDSEIPTATILQGDAREILKGLPEKSVHMCVTSPPYWGLRDYGLEPLVWDGSQADNIKPSRDALAAQSNCDHKWGKKSIKKYSGGTEKAKTGQHRDNHTHFEASQGQFCQLCNAWRGSLGLEPTPELYVHHLVEIFREVRRVLRDDGTVWLNLGSSFISKTMESEEMTLREDLTKEEIEYVLKELAKYVKC
jgi:DNA modification methylase